MKSFYTHKGANLPPYFKGFPMSLVLIFGGIMLGVILVSLLIGLALHHLLVGVVFMIVTVGLSGYFLFFELKKIGPFGLEKKFLVKYFKSIDKLEGGRPKLIRVKLL